MSELLTYVLIYIWGCVISFMLGFHIKRIFDKNKRLSKLKPEDIISQSTISDFVKLQQEMKRMNKYFKDKAKSFEQQIDELKNQKNTDIA
jgi:hypothetical protein